ncbi:hypothetical protein SISNIDRAFT_487480 [Sistotremastrum niveocremeum HHB9708]|uniref:Uncharacterized protein n=1 Tax=Sistotremastrum niveocremeum HHB9708 TaxID=1314777 RepID=A0A164SIC1_9AGAM|nr:hypothetical protein SISNIDRAFT_487480 [Sistotremastrum niveocremeum HHB9708]
MADPVAIVALVVSLVALIVALFQVAQQYAATAYDYRKCSPQTIGGWASRTCRKFRKELRIEIMYSAPHIELSKFREIEPEIFHFFSRNQGVGKSGSTVEKASYNSLNTILVPIPLSRLPDEGPAEYLVVEKDKPLVLLETQTVSTAFETPLRTRLPWYLDISRTRPEACCSWLNILSSTLDTHLSFTITARQESVDYMPDGVNKPLASMTKSDFLTLMSLFGFHWRDRGMKGVPTGSSATHELTVRELMHFGIVYLFSERKNVKSFNLRQQQREYYIPSREAQLAMFNRFELGFMTINTHDTEEIVRSLTQYSEVDMLEHMPPAGAAIPGISEIIAMWGYPCMARLVQGTEFESRYSLLPTPNALHNATLVQMLCNQESSSNKDAGGDRHWDAAKYQFKQWSDRYVRSLPATSDIVLDLVEYANVLQSDASPSWAQALRCIDYIKQLDEHLEQKLLPGTAAENKQEREDLKRKIAFLQLKAFSVGSRKAQVGASPARLASQTFSKEMSAKAVAFYSGELAVAIRSLSSTFGTQKTEAMITEESSRDIVINRLIRGIMWNIANGNAPHRTKRALECSLDSAWLEDESTVYIS